MRAALGTAPRRRPATLFPCPPGLGRMRGPRGSRAVRDGWLVPREAWVLRARHPRESLTGKPPWGLFFWWAFWPIFVCGARAPPEGALTVTGTLRERLIALIEPVVGRMGFELVQLEYAAGRGHAVLRLYIDREAGVGLDDCERVSREVSALLDVEDPIPSAYTLEVSSPGFDRVLRTAAHFGRFVGSRVFVELKEPRAGRRRYTGTLLTVDEAGIALEVDREHVALAFNEIGKARLAT
jgi:ribosome maturation factor RimP